MFVGFQPRDVPVSVSGAAGSCRDAGCVQDCDTTVGFWVSATLVRGQLLVQSYLANLMLDRRGIQMEALALIQPRLVDGQILQGFSANATFAPLC